QGLKLADIQIRDPQQSLTADWNVDDGRQRLRVVWRSVRGRRLHGARLNRVRIAAAVQKEILILHVREAFRVECHANEMEVGIEPVNLKRILDVVSGRTVAI